MCGLNGLFAYHGAASPPSRDELWRTRDHMAARGPDGVGEWWNPDRRLGLGHRRLAIIDLDARSDQPMVSADGGLVVVFNGEIYNFPMLKAELEAQGRVFRTTSDTEVLLHLYEQYGQDMIPHLNGMYAFAIWDSRRRGLFIARDPYGIKPLYTADDGWTFRFASQVKALQAGGRISRDPSPAGVVGFHLMGSVPEPFTVYQSVRCLPAGHSQWIDDKGPRAPQPFASIAKVLAGQPSRALAAGEIDQRIRAATLDSVSRHRLADVEVGVFLSAGIDSGALLGLMRDSGQQRIRAITLGFDEFKDSADDETPLAGRIAALYGAEHVQRRVGEAEFREDFPRILEAMDQPSIDGVNTWFVAKAAKEARLKVALSGLGGDEILAGYPSFRDIPRWVNWIRAPSALPGLGRGLRALGAGMGLAKASPKTLGLLEYGGGYAGAYMLRRGVFLPFELDVVLDPDLVKEGLRRLRPLKRLTDSASPASPSPTARVCALESANYLRNQLLRDADWAGMASSLEIRTPLVDFDLLKTLAPIVPQLGGGVGKQSLARAPSTPLPAFIAERAKTGFSVPTATWLAKAVSAGRKPKTTRGLTSRAWARELYTLHEADDQA